MTTSCQSSGIVLFAHGSRDPLWRLPMDAVAARINALSPEIPVVCAFLELTTPDLPTAVQMLVDQRVNRVTVVPMFLGVGRHAREDLPVLMTQLQSQHPALEFRLQTAVGEDRRLTELLAQMALE